MYIISTKILWFSILSLFSGYSNQVLHSVSSIRIKLRRTTRYRDYVIITSQEEDEALFLVEKAAIEGMVITWSKGDAFFIDLREFVETEVPYALRYLLVYLLISPRIKRVREAFQNKTTDKILFNMKPHLKLLFKYKYEGKSMIFLRMKLQVGGRLMDPKICAWIFNPDENKEKSMEQLLQENFNIKFNNVGLLSSAFQKACLRVGLLKKTC